MNRLDPLAGDLVSRLRCFLFGHQPMRWGSGDGDSCFIVIIGTAYGLAPGFHLRFDVCARCGEIARHR